GLVVANQLPVGIGEKAFRRDDDRCAVDGEPEAASVQVRHDAFRRDHQNRSWSASASARRSISASSSGEPPPDSASSEKEFKLGGFCEDSDSATSGEDAKYDSSENCPFL